MTVPAWMVESGWVSGWYPATPADPTRTNTDLRTCAVCRPELLLTHVTQFSHQQLHSWANAGH